MLLLCIRQFLGKKSHPMVCNLIQMKRVYLILAIRVITINYSITAIDLINNLLQVKQRKRFTVDKSLQHVWLQARVYKSIHN